MNPENTLESMLQALLDECAPFAEQDWPFDYEWGCCYWCQAHQTHVEGCPYETARVYLNGGAA